MIHRTRTHLASLAAFASLALVGCQDAMPERLTAPADPAALPSSGAYVTSVSVRCPVSIHVGGFAYCSASAHYSDGSINYAPGATWTSTNPAVLSVSGGMVFGTAVGTASAKATVGTVSGTAVVQVRQPPQATSVVVSPAVDSVQIGGTRPFTAKVYDQNGALRTNPLVGWSVDDPSVASISSSGVATALALGTTTVRATVGTVTGTAQLTATHVVSISGPQTANHSSVTLTATPHPGGTYHYTWKTKRCTVGGTCEATFSPATQGTNLTSYTDFVSRHDVNLVVLVEIRANPDGPRLASYPHHISGEGEPLPIGPGSCTPRLFC